MAKQTLRRTLSLIAIAIVSAVPASSQLPSELRDRSKISVPVESVGINGIVQSLITAFDYADVVALGEAHGHFARESDLRIALVRSPEFAKKVHYIVVEFGSTTEQEVLDRYIRGEDVSPVQLALVWKTTTQATNGVWDSPVYQEFFAAVRDVNLRLPVDRKIHVLGGDPGPGDTRSREAAAIAVLKEQVLKKHGKALVIYGAAHFYRSLPKAYLASMGEDVGIAKTLETEFPGRTFVVLPLGRLDRPRPVAVDVEPDFTKIDRAIRTKTRPVMMSLHRPPFLDLSAEEFLGRSLTTCRGGCGSVFRGSGLTLGEMGDATIYFGELDSEAAKSR